MGINHLIWRLKIEEVCDDVLSGLFVMEVMRDKEERRV